MVAKRGRIADQQQFAPCAGHAHVHAADVRQEADLALGVAACQGDGNDVALLALKRIDGANTQPALQQQVVQHGAVFDGVFQIVDLGAVRCNHANGQRALIWVGGFAWLRQLGQQLRQALQQQVGFFGVGG